MELDLEAEGLLSPNWDGTYVGSGGLGYTTELPSEGFRGKVRWVGDLDESRRDRLATR